MKFSKGWQTKSVGSGRRFVRRLLRVFRRPTVFGRLFGTYMTITFISLLVLGVLLARLFQNYIYAERQAQLIAHGEEINKLVASYLHGEISLNRLQERIEVLSRAAGAMVWIADRGGLVYLSSTPENPVEGSRIGKEEIDILLKGEIFTQIGQFENRFGDKMMSVGVPIIVDGRIEGAIFLHTPVRGLQYSLTRVYRIIWVTVLVAMVTALPLTYYLADRLTNPIRQMTSVARAIARGDFSRRVEYDSQDEIGQLVATFNAMCRDLGRLEEMRREFIANVSHELRSPLTSIRGFIQAILDGTVPPEEQEHYLRIVAGETERLTRLVNDLLELARLQGGAITLSPQRVDLEEAFAALADRFAPRLQDKKLELRVEIGREAGEVWADRDRLDQILTNLLDNAINFTPAGGWIEIRSRRGENEPDRIWIEVEDSGPGIPPGEREYIFERFYRVDRSRSRARGGTGLGLAIVKHLVQLHGGEIEVAEGRTGGALFRFYLPRSDQNE